MSPPAGESEAKRRTKLRGRGREVILPKSDRRAQRGGLFRARATPLDHNETTHTTTLHMEQAPTSTFWPISQPCPGLGGGIIEGQVGACVCSAGSSDDRSVQCMARMWIVRKVRGAPPFVTDSTPPTHPLRSQQRTADPLAYLYSGAFF